MIEKLFHIHIESFVGLSIVGNVVAGLKELEVFVSIQAIKLKLSGVNFYILEIVKMLVNIFSSLWNAVLLQIVVLLSFLHKCLNVVVLITRLKHEVIVVTDLKHLRNGIKGFIPGDEAGKEHLSIDCGH